MKNKCENCLLAYQASNAPKDSYACHKNPPVTYPTARPNAISGAIEMGFITIWPIVNGEDFCSQYAPGIDKSQRLKVVE